MNQKEKKEISISMSILMDTILNKDSSSEEVANSAVSFAADILKRFPEIRKLVEDMISDDWDNQIAWIDWEKSVLK